MTNNLIIVKYLYLGLFFIFISTSLFAQSPGVSISEEGTEPDPSAMLDVMSTDKGFLPPRMTENERNEIVSPAEGLMIFNTDTKCINVFNGIEWVSYCPQESIAQLCFVIYEGSISVNEFGTIFLSAPTIGESPFTYSWSGPSGFTSSEQNPEIDFADPNMAGTYTVTLTDNSGCTATSSTEVNIIPWSCGDNLIDIRDGNQYNTIEIGGQCWMAENLGYLPEVNSPGTNSSVAPLYYVYGYNGTNVTDAKASANYSEYGALYNWSAAENACPEGWHLPSDVEWQTLEIYLGMTAAEANSNGWRTTGDVAEKLKINTWGAGSTNLSGFTAMPGGHYNGSSSFSDLNSWGYWWTSTPSSGSAYRRILKSDPGVFRSTILNTQGYSVRCIAN